RLISQGRVDTLVGLFRDLAQPELGFLLRKDRCPRIADEVLESRLRISPVVQVIPALQRNQTVRVLENRCDGVAGPPPFIVAPAGIEGKTYFGEVSLAREPDPLLRRRIAGKYGSLVVRRPPELQDHLVRPDLGSKVRWVAIAVGAISHTQPQVLFFKSVNRPP